MELIEEQDDDQATQAANEHDQTEDGTGVLLPGKPVADYIGPSFATVTWPAPADQLLGLPTARNIVGYSLVASKGGQRVKTVEVKGSTALAARLPGLEPNTEYVINVMTRLGSGLTSAGPSATFKTKTSEPGAVVKPTISNVGMTHVLLKWSAPVNGGAPIKFYRIQKQRDGSGDYSPIVENGIVMEDTGNANVERVIRGLHPGKVYAFKVQAVNSVGNGPFSERSNHAMTAKRSVPGPPGAPIVSEVTTRGLTLTWDPANSHGSEINGYQLMVKKSTDAEFFNFENVLRMQDLKIIDQKLSYRIDNLTPGQSLLFKVRSFGQDGYGPLSSPSLAAYTRGTVPDAPGACTVDNVTSNSAHLQWTAPADNGDAITNYNIFEQEGSRGGYIQIVRGFKGTEYTRQGLKFGGIAYQWRIQADNKFGPSPMSAASDTVTTSYDYALETKKRLLDDTATSKLSQLRDRLRMLAAQTVQALTGEKNATSSASEERRVAEKAMQTAKESKAEVITEKSVAAQQMILQKQSSLRALALQQQASDDKMDVLKAGATAERNTANQNAADANKKINKYKSLVAASETKAEEDTLKIRKMRMEGCKHGIVKWCP